MTTIIRLEKSTGSTSLRRGSLGIGLALTANTGLYLLGSIFTFPANAIAPTGSPIMLSNVLISTLIGGLLATGVYRLLNRFLADTMARRVMWVLTVLVLLASIPGPFQISNVPLSEVIVLEIMHFVAGLSPVYLLTKSQPS
jgi:hypothetical protein